MKSFCADLPRCCARSPFANRGRAVLCHGVRLGRLGPAVRPPAAGRAASVPRDPCRIAPCRRHAGDLLFHIRAKRMDSASNWRRRSWPGSAMRCRRWMRCRASGTSTTATCWASSTARRTHAEQAALDATVIGAEDAAFAGGSYVIVQKYLHDMAGVECAVHRSAGTHHRPHEALGHRAGRCGEADLGAQRADGDRGERQERSRSSAPTCRSASRPRANSAPISSATAARRGPSSRC